MAIEYQPFSNVIETDMLQTGSTYSYTFGNVWLQVEIYGTLAQTWFSTDAYSWIATTSVNYNFFNVTYYVGPYVCAHNDGSYWQAAFTGMQFNYLSTASCLAGWTSTTVGTAYIGSYTCASPSVMYITGSGADYTIGGPTFQYQYLYQPMLANANVNFTVLVSQWGLQVNGASKAGILVSSNPNSPSITNQMEFAWLPYADVIEYQFTSTSNAVNLGSSPPVWLRIQIVGSVLNSSYSLDNLTWTPFGSQVYTAFNAPFYVGLFVCSHNDGTLWQAKFQNILLQTS